MHEGSAKTARSMVISRCVSEKSCVICWMVVGCPYPLTGVTSCILFCGTRWSNCDSFLINNIIFTRK